jgi:hypothetical protein
MSIFGSIMSSIFGTSKGSAASAPPAQTAAQPGAVPGASVSTQGPSTAAPKSKTPGATVPTSAAPAGAAKPTVDVAAIMDELAANSKQKLNWRTSIVDLMKLLNLDSSLTARKQLAKELHYTGDLSDSASMNIWLHKQVMVKLAENGGKVPEDLKN